MATDLLPQLETKAALIRKELKAIEAALTSTTMRALLIGEWLIEAEPLVPHGQWLSWLTNRCQIEPRFAQRCMRLARNRPEIEAKATNLSHLTMDKALKLIAPVPAHRLPPSDEDDTSWREGLTAEQQAFVERAVASPRKPAAGQDQVSPFSHHPAPEPVLYPPPHPGEGQGVVAGLRARVAASVASWIPAVRPAPSLEEQEEEALETLATLMIESATDAGEPPVAVRLFLNDIAECFQRCRHPLKWALYLRQRGDEVVAEAAADAKTMKLSGGGK